jgi:hypothetical protein
VDRPDRFFCASGGGSFPLLVVFVFGEQLQFVALPDCVSQVIDHFEDRFRVLYSYDNQLRAESQNIGDDLAALDRDRPGLAGDLAPSAP